jgi:hypothetical protein
MGLIHSLGHCWASTFFIKIRAIVLATNCQMSLVSFTDQQWDTICEELY